MLLQEVNNLVSYNNKYSLLTVIINNNILVIMYYIKLHG